MKITALAAVASGLVLAACASSENAAKMEPMTPTEQFAIDVQSEPVTLMLAPHSEGASRNQAQALADYAQGWRDYGGGDVIVQAPEHAGDPDAAYRTANDARDILTGAGVPSAKIRIVGVAAQGDARPVITLTYAKYKAKGPECGRAWENLTQTADNRPYKNLGCSLTANMAAQIAYPADIIAPRDMDAPDAARRQQVLDKYRKGEASSSAKDEQANGVVSTAVQ